MRVARSTLDARDRRVSTTPFAPPSATCSPPRRGTLVAMLAGALVCGGCWSRPEDRSKSPPDGAAPAPQVEVDPERSEERPPAPAKSYREGLERVGELSEQVRAAFEAEDHEAAHPPLHALAPLLRELPRLADQESFDEAERLEIHRALGELFVIFGEIDERLHGGLGASYEDRAERIDAAIRRLQPQFGPRDR